MSEDGLVDGAADVLAGTKKSEDYHSEMNSVFHEDWIRFSSSHIEFSIFVIVS